MSFPTLFQEFIYTRTYSRWIDELNRRETWPETVERYITYMQTKLGDKITPKELKEARQAILNFEVMPSMRALWASGPAADADNISFYNCSFIAITKLRNFAEIMYVLMNGTGAGFSVERQFIEQLPVIQTETRAGEPEIVIFEDSKQGWAEGFEKVLNFLWAGVPVKCDYSKIRPKGARLKTFGGRCSGPQCLMDLVNFTTTIVERNRGHKLESIDVHDICCKIADIVVVGGTRRCLHFSAPVFTTNGIKEIQYIETGDLIEVGGKSYKVKGKVFSGKQKTLKIKHMFGEVPPCSFEHRIAVFEDNSTEIIFKFAKDLKVGDCLVWDSQGYTGKKTALPKFEEKFHFNSKKFTIPELTSDIAWLFGYIHGNGCISSRTIEITAPTHNRNVLEFSNCIFEKFGLKGSIIKGHGNCLVLRVNSAQLCRWFNKNIKVSHENIKIPTFITNAKKDIRRAYLAGIFDADGRSRSDGVCEQVTTVYENYAKEIRLVLASLGIGCTIHSMSAEKRRLEGSKAKDFYTINIIGITNRQKWLNEIGIFSISGKIVNISAVGSPVDFKYKVSMLGNPVGWKKDGYITLKTALNHDLVQDPIYYPTVITEIAEFTEEDTYDIEIEEIEMFNTAGIVVHNSACISLSDLSDRTMASAKSGSFWDSEPQRMLANNSAVYNRKPTVDTFLEEWKSLYQSKSGERGIFNRESAVKKVGENNRRDTNHLFSTNPCGEIILRADGQFCNLSEVVVRPEDTFDSLKRKIKIASMLGTWQSTFTDFKYVDKKWIENTEEERLLGVSLTGLRDHPILGSVNDTAKKWLADLKHVAVHTNKKLAVRLNINQATAVTTTKPSGTVSLLVDAAPGAHTRQTKTGYYIRRVRISATDPLFRMLAEQGIPFQCEVGQSPENCSNYVLEFPMKVPENAITRKNETALEQLEYWLMLRTFWTEHNPSITVSVKEDEWLDTGAWVYNHFDDICGVSFLPSSDHVYQLAPYEDITKEQYEKLAKEMPLISFERLSDYELEDATLGSKEYACQGGSCELV